MILCGLESPGPYPVPGILSAVKGKSTGLRGLFPRSFLFLEIIGQEEMNHLAGAPQGTQGFFIEKTFNPAGVADGHLDLAGRRPGDAFAGLEKDIEGGLIIELKANPTFFDRFEPNDLFLRGRGLCRKPFDALLGNRFGGPNFRHGSFGRKRNGLDRSFGKI